jgi:hypothetical protein
MTETFFKSTNREMPEFIINAYRYGTFAKIDEFLQFQKRIQKKFEDRSRERFQANVVRT